MAGGGGGGTVRLDTNVTNNNMNNGDQHQVQAVQAVPQRRLSRYASLLQLDLDRLTAQQQQQGQREQNNWTSFRGPQYGGEFCANSFLGWHNSMAMPPRSTSSMAMPPRSTSCWSLPDSANKLNNNNEFISSEPYAQQYQHHQYHQQPQNHRQHQHQSVWKVIVTLGLLLVLIGGVIVLLLATVFKVQNTSDEGIGTMRGRRGGVQLMSGHVHVVSGALLQFDAQLLHSNSDKFRAHSRRIEQALDEIFERSSLRSAYEGSRVTSYRFVIAVPALDVSFQLRMKTNAEVDVLDLLSILRNDLRDNDGLDGSKVDLKSISLEPRRLVL